MIDTHTALYDRVTYPLYTCKLGQYRLVKIVLPQHTFLYNDEAHIVLVTETLNDQVFYIHCTPAEYSILRQFLGAPHEAISFEQLADQFLEQFEYERDIRALRRHISRLKRKLPSPLTIVSVREVGYALHDFILYH